MLSSLGQRRAKLLAAVVITAALASGCFGGASVRTSAPGGLPGELAALTNQARAEHGLPPLAWDQQLEGLAQDWAARMAGTGVFAHRDLASTIRTPAYRGYARLGENILVGTCGMSAGEMHQAWMNSPSHRANILSSGYNAIGIGVLCAPDGRVWATQNFGQR